MKAAVKYCGGCNSRYDRVALVKTLKRQLQIEIPPACPDKIYDVIYVVCGCTARCPDLSSLSARQFCILDHEEIPKQIRIKEELI